MAFLRPVLPEAMKSAYVASTSDIARASFTQQHLQEEQPWDQIHLSQCANPLNSQGVCMALKLSKGASQTL